MPSLCQISVELDDRAGAAVANATIEVNPLQPVVGLDDIVLVAENLSFTMDANGIGTMGLYPGHYEGRVIYSTGAKGQRFAFSVPYQASANLAALLPQNVNVNETYIEAFRALVAQAQTARDQAEVFSDQAENFSGQVDGSAFAQKASNLSDLSNTAAARQNLGLSIGEDVQAFDENLAALAQTVSPAGLALIDDASAAAQRSTLGLGNAATATVINNSDPAVSPANIGTRGNMAAFVNTLTSMKELATSNMNGDAVADFTAFDPTIYAHYYLTWLGLTPAVAGAQLLGRTSSNAGLNFDIGEGDYDLIASFTAFGGTGSRQQASANAIEMTGGAGVGTTQGNSAAGSMLILDPNADTLFCPMMITNRARNNSGQPYFWSGAGTRKSTTPVNGIRIMFSTGAIATGRFRFFGIRR